MLLGSLLMFVDAVVSHLGSFVRDVIPGILWIGLEARELLSRPLNLLLVPDPDIPGSVRPVAFWIGG